MDKWDGRTERRLKVRRESDKLVCPFHKIKCDSIQDNKNSIHEIEKNMATKADLKEVKDMAESKAPRWVLILLVTLCVATFSYLAIRMEGQVDKVSLIKANQEVLLKAFHIKPVPASP